MRGLEQIPWLYDACCAVQERLGFRHWRDWLTAGARGRTLSIGCGTGRNLPLYPPGVRVIGLDPGRELLLRARRRAPAVPLVQAHAEALPFRSGVFGTVVSSLTFCSVADPPRALAEIRRVLAPAGTLRMIEHVRAVVPWRARLQDFVQPAWTRLTGGCHPNRATERAVSAAGFRIDPGDRLAKGVLRRFSARLE